MEIKNIDLREEYFNDIHNMKPKWWMRWGILSVFFILLIILSLGYIVKYPDVIYSEFRLTTNKPSVTLPLAQGSQIEKLLINNNDVVTPYTSLLVIKNNSNYKDVFLLKKELNNFTFENDSILSFFIRFLNYDLQLGGNIENNWTSFSSELLEYYKIKQLETYQSQIQFLEKELSKQINLKKHYRSLIFNDSEQKELLNEKIKTDSTLYAKGIISRMQFNTNKRDFFQRSKALENNTLALNKTNLDIVKLQNAIINHGNNEKAYLLDKQLSIRKSLNKLKSSIVSWEQTYLLISPIEGNITFIQDLKEDAFYTGNAIVVTPKEKSYYATVNIPFIGAGKIEVGQRVVLKLNDYPYREYGILEGILHDFSPVAGENYYLGKVVISKNQISSYGRTIKIKENMSGIGEIITNDRSILGRLFERIIYAFNS